jgi:predicted Zn-ribbon and HTH transcriptional regulator
MFLIKCKCKHFFTIDELFTSSRDLRCPNCKTSLYINGSEPLHEIAKDLERAGMEYQFIPDSAKITVTFDI